MNFLRIPVDGVGFNKISMEKINFRVFTVQEAQFRDFLLNGNKILGFSRMKLISIDFHSTSFMLHGVTNADMFFPWVSQYLKLTFLLFSMNFFPWNFSKKVKLTCFSLRWIWFQCVSHSMISVVFCVFCPWNSFLGFLPEDLFPWRNSYQNKLTSTGFQSLCRFLLWTLQRFSYNNRQRKLVIRRNYQQRFFHERFSKEDCELVFFSDDIDFQHILVVEKIFRGLPMDEIGGVSLKKTSLLALQLYEIGSSGVPVSDIVLGLVSP